MGKGIYARLVKCEPIINGWSEDKKYCASTADGEKYLLRITSISRYEARKSLFCILQQLAALDVPMCKPIEFGVCNDGVYSIQSWINGEDLEVRLPQLPEAGQYALGFKSGEILRKIHSIFVSDTPSERPDWAESFDHTASEKIQKYHDCGVRFDGDEDVLAYIKRNQHLTKTRTRCFQHGDYCVRNMMLENDELKIIDFERLYFGDPWEDFMFVLLDAPKYPCFTAGQFRGYFGGEPPREFFSMYAFYVLGSILPGIYEAVPAGSDEVNRMTKQAQEILAWFDDLNNPVPTWYLKDFHVR